MNNKKQRLRWVDFLKGIGIVFVIVAHTSTNDALRKLIHSFHMPLFFVVSGYLTSREVHSDRVGYIRRKAKALLIPYVLFGLFTYAIWLLRYSKEIMSGEIVDWYSPILHLFWINSTGLKISGEFWFLSALFIASILFDAVKQRCVSQKAMAICVVIISVFGCYFRKTFDRQLPWSMLSGFVGVGFIYIGYLLRNGKKKGISERLMNLKVGEIFALFIVTTILAFLNGKVDMRRSSYSNVLLFWLNAASFSLILMNISQKIYMKKGKRYNLVMDFFEEIGRDSMTYVCLNSMVIKAVSAVFRLLFGFPAAGIATYVFELACIVLSILCIYYVNKAIYALKMEFILGK